MMERGNSKLTAHRLCCWRRPVTGSALRVAARLALPVACLLALAACASTTQTVTVVPRTLIIAGPPDILPLVQEMATTFAATHPGLSIDTRPVRETEAQSDLRLGTVDIAVVHTSPLSPDRLTVEIARQPISVIVHPDNPVRNLSLDDLGGIYAGRIVEWRQVGGGENPIMVLSREPMASVRLHMDSALLGSGGRLTANALLLPSDLAMIATVARRLEAIGYVETVNPPADVKVVSVENEQPQSVVRGRPYPLWQPVVLVTRQPPTPDVSVFLSYVKSKQGQRLVAAWGYGQGGDMQ